MPIPRSLRIGLLLVLLGSAVIVAVLKGEQWLAVRRAEGLLRRPLPAAISGASMPMQRNAALPLEVNLDVPFTSQAPLGTWDALHKEACEEAAAIMAIRYVFGTTFLDPDEADAGIRNLVETNAKKFGYSVDQTAAQLERLILDVDPKIPVRLLPNPSVEDLKAELAAGHVVIVPAAGRMLGNPFYRTPGPLYHMLVLRGYTADGYFITNDAGTKRGEGYLYPFALIMDAMHDWNAENIEQGQKVVLVLEPLKMEN